MDTFGNYFIITSYQVSCQGYQCESVWLLLSVVKLKVKLGTEIHSVQFWNKEWSGLAFEEVLSHFMSN